MSHNPRINRRIVTTIIQNTTSFIYPNKDEFKKIVDEKEKIKQLN